VAIECHAGVKELRVAGWTGKLKCPEFAGVCTTSTPSVRGGVEVCSGVRIEPLIVTSTATNDDNSSDDGGGGGAVIAIIIVIILLLLCAGGGYCFRDKIRGLRSMSPQEAQAPMGSPTRPKSTMDTPRSFTDTPRSGATQTGSDSWVEGKDDSGPYYLNAETQERRRTKPAGFVSAGYGLPDGLDDESANMSLEAGKGPALMGDISPQARHGSATSTVNISGFEVVSPSPQSPPSHTAAEKHCA